MGGQVLGGGVVVLVCVLLWLVYLLPSWASRRRYDAVERNAVRLNQALRILAETSETPDEVRLELSARTAFAQQRLARRSLAERDELARRSQAEREELTRRSQAERDAIERKTLEEREAARLEEARRALRAAQQVPAARHARARRRARLAVTIVAVTAVALAAFGTWTATQTGGQTLLWAGVALMVVSALLLRRMSQVSARASAPAVETVSAEHEPTAVQDVPLPGDRRAWAPRALPRPLTASVGSQASAQLDAEEARHALRRAAAEESLRERAQAQRPPSIVAARRARESATLAGAGHDDAEIEAHVRRLLERRASGE